VPEYLSPGVYIEEVSTGPRPIEGVGTAMAGFVGFADNGPINKPMLITSWEQYVKVFGALEDGGVRTGFSKYGYYLGQSIFGFFSNGGRRCYVTRVNPQITDAEKNPAVFKALETSIPSRASKAMMSLFCQPKQVTGSDISVEVMQPSNGSDTGEGGFNLKITMESVEEVFENLVIGKPQKGAKATSVAEALASSKLISVIVEEKASGTLAERAPEIGVHVIKSSQSLELIPVQSNTFIGNVDDRSGLEGLEIADDVTMVCAPDIMWAYENGKIDKDGVKAVQLAMITHCERLMDRVAIIDPLPNMTPQQVKKWREKESNFDSSYAALYYPWIKVNGPDGKPIAVPPSGHMAGIWSRSDNERGVHKAPANEVVRGALEPSYEVTKNEQDTLNPTGINCIRTFTARGVRVWGARTLSSDPQWRYLNVRRLFNYIEKSCFNGTQWIVFEPNNKDLWERTKRDLTAFLKGVWRDGALFGSTPEEAFRVIVDESNNPADERDRGFLTIDIALAPVKPAEFIRMRFGQKMESE
jgi:uncharacterized protein